MEQARSIKREDGMVVIRIPKSDVLKLRVALNCPCGAPKSKETDELRKALVRALGAFQ